MNSHNPFNTGGDGGCTNDFRSADQLVDRIIGDAYHVVKEVYLALGNLTYIYNYLQKYGLIITVDSEDAIKDIPLSIGKFARVYNKSETAGYYFTDYLYVADDTTGIPSNDPTATGSWVSTKATGSNASFVRIWKYRAEADGVTSIELPTDIPIVGVQTIYVEGVRQDINEGFSYNEGTATITLADSLEAGNLVTVIIGITDPDLDVDVFAILKNSDGASNIGTSDGSTVQQELDTALKSFISLEKGGVLTKRNQLVYDGESFYNWRGDLPKTIPAGSTISSLGGVGKKTWGVISMTEASQLLWKRNKLITAITGVGGLLDSQWVSIWEFANEIVDMPTSNPQTWDWTPAFVAARDYIESYVQQVAVNSTMWGTKTLFVPSGIYLLKEEVLFTQYANSRGSLSTGYRIVGDGMTSTVIQPVTDGQTAFRATNCKFNLQDIGFRAGAKYNKGVVMGSTDKWEPVFHSNWDRVGFSGFARGVVGNLVFDSTFIDVFVQEITEMQDISEYSAGVDFPAYMGPANNSEDAVNTGDCSNNITFIRLTVETAKTNNAIMINLRGRNNSYANHAFNFFAGHVETHNRYAKTLSVQNSININAFGVIFSQNGDEDTPPTRVMYFNNASDICLQACRIITNNVVAAYADTDTKMIAVEGNSGNVSFPHTYVRTPYYNLNTYNVGIAYCIDSSNATRGVRSYDDTGVIINQYSNKKVASRRRLTSMNSIGLSFEERVEADGSLVWAYSTSRDDTTVPTDRMSLTSAGALQTTGNLQIGAMSSSGATRGIDWINNGDKATILAYLRSDTVGRLYFSSYGSAQNWVMGSATFNPTTDNTASLGAASTRMSAVYSVMYRFTATVGHYYGTGSPEGTLTAGVGSLYSRTDGAAGTSLYVKETGTGNTGWVAK